MLYNKLKYFKVSGGNKKIPNNNNKTNRNLAGRSEKQLKFFMFKTMNNLVPEYLFEKFSNVNTIHRHNLTRALNNLFIPWPNTEALQKSLPYKGTVRWNSRPAGAKWATTLNSFYSSMVN